MNVYLDNNSSCPIDSEVLELLVKSLKEHFGNPSSVHQFGKMSRKAVNGAREQIASYLGRLPQEIVFNSGATEGLNHIFYAIGQKKPGHIITSSLEHAAVIEPIQRLVNQGFCVTFLSPGRYGTVTEDALKGAIQEDTCLISLMAVNNETGVKTDLSMAAKVAREAGIPLIVDGVALLGKEPFQIEEGIKAMCFSGHKIHAPKGVGFSFIDRHFKLASMIIGGDQELKMRSGTENVSAIAAIGKAVDLLNTYLPQATDKMLFLRDKLEKGIKAFFPNMRINGDGPRVVNTSNICFSGKDGESLLIALDLKGIAVSHGSACSSGALEPSRVLLNMGLSREEAASSLRFSLSRQTSEQDIDTTLKTLKEIL